MRTSLEQLKPFVDPTQRKKEKEKTCAEQRNPTRKKRYAIWIRKKTHGKNGSKKTET